MVDWTPLFRLYARWRLGTLARLDPAAAQERELLKLVSRARQTRFGRDHDFASIRSVADYQARTPLRNYERMWHDYWRPAFPVLDDISWPGRIPFFAVSSGTTSGTSKYIPLTPAMRRSNVRAALDVLAAHARADPRSRFFGGTSLMLGGSTDLVEEAPGVFSGDLSGFVAKTMPAWARRFAFPPNEIALLSDWDEKLNRIAEASLARSIRVITGTPSWLLILLERVAALRHARGETALYPDLRLLVHGGVNFAPYRERFAQLFEGRNVDFREVYPASEGFIAFADRGPGEGLRLMLDNGIFFEFVPVEELASGNPARHWAGSVRPGIDYAVAMTTNSGLFSYLVGDTVRFIDTKLPRLLITGRTAYMLSAFGEHLIGEEIEEAVAAAARQIGAHVTDFSVGALHPEREGDLGRHQYVVEFETLPDAAAVTRFSQTVDAELLRINDDYRAHRGGDHGMLAPHVHAVPPGTYAQWMRVRGRLGGQNKVPRVINDPELFTHLRAFCGAQNPSSSS